jgi:hypothetical protein
MKCSMRITVDSCFAQRIIAVCATLLLNVVAIANTEGEDRLSPPPAEEIRLARALATAIYQVVPEEKERFELRYARPESPVFLSESSNAFEKVHCERLAAVEIINQQGRIGVAKCKNGLHVRELAAKSGAMTVRKLKELDLKLDDTGKAPFEYARERLNDGSEYHYMTVFDAGHGFMLAFTGVLHDKKTNSAVIIQADLDKLCTDVEAQKIPPSCLALLHSFKQIAQNMLTIQ